MKGIHQIKIYSNNSVNYIFTLKRNITVLRGDSAIGKTLLCNIIQDYNLSIERGQNPKTTLGITIESDADIIIGSENILKWDIEELQDKIIIFDENYFDIVLG